jgi:hypothetical protein
MNKIKLIIIVLIISFSMHSNEFESNYNDLGVVPGNLLLEIGDTISFELDDITYYAEVTEIRNNFRGAEKYYIVDNIREASDINENGRNNNDGTGNFESSETYFSNDQKSFNSSNIGSYYSSGQAFSSMHREIVRQRGHVATSGPLFSKKVDIEKIKIENEMRRLEYDANTNYRKFISDVAHTHVQNSMNSEIFESLSGRFNFSSFDSDIKKEVRSFFQNVARQYGIDIKSFDSPLFEDPITFDKNDEIDFKFYKKYLNLYNQLKEVETDKSYQAKIRLSQSLIETSQNFKSILSNDDREYILKLASNDVQTDITGGIFSSNLNNVINLLTQAKSLSEVGNCVWQKRLSERAIILLAYTINDKERLETFLKLKLNQNEKNFFNLDIDSSTFYGYELIKVSKELYSFSEIENNPYLRFLSVLSVNQTNNHIQYNDFSGFGNSLDNSWRIVDYLKGFTKGLSQYVFDFATGMYQLVTHPIDTAKGIYNAIVNYDKTYEIISQKIENIIDDYPNYSVEEKAKLHAQIGAEIGSLFIGIGAIKHLSKTGKITNIISNVSNKFTPIVSESIKNLNNFKIFTKSKFITKTDVIFGNKIFKGELFGKSKIIKEYSPLQFGVSVLHRNVIECFLGQKYWSIKPIKGEKFYRIGTHNGSWWTRLKPKSQIIAMSENAILPEWNKFSIISEIIIPDNFNHIIYEGLSANMGGIINKSYKGTSSYFHGGINQVYIPKSIIKNLKVKTYKLGD